MTVRSIRTLALLPALVLMLQAAAPVHASDEWYGVVTVRSVQKEEQVSDPAFKQYNPALGERTGHRRHTTQWIASIRYLPGPKAIQQLSYRDEEDKNWVSTRTKDCVPSGKGTYQITDQEQYTASVTSTTESQETQSIALGGDGSYSTMVFIGGDDGTPQPVAKGFTLHQTRDTCIKPPVWRDEQKIDNPLGLMPLTVPITGKAKPDATVLKGSNRYVSDDGKSVTNVSWVLRRKSSKLRAVIHGPKAFERASNITLDGRSSTGNINKYTWEFEPDENCTLDPWNHPVTMTGSSAHFRGLCSFTAYLTVEDDKTADTTAFYAEVKDRKKSDWSIHFDANPGKWIDSPILVDGTQLGTNQCALDAKDKPLGHAIHTTDPNNQTWKDVGYRIAQVEDQGPFQGLYYVRSQDLRVDRKERVNIHLQYKGSFWDVNRRHQYSQQFKALVKQVNAHEKAHSTLYKQAIGLLGEREPARAIERLVATQQDPLVKKADSVVSAANSFLYFYGIDDHRVADLLSKQGGFDRTVCVWIPRSNGDPAYPTFWGLLSALGDEAHDKSDDFDKALTEGKGNTGTTICPKW